MTPAAGGLLDRTAIEALQLRELQILVGALLVHNRFYSCRLKSAGMHAGLTSLAEFTSSMPFTDKSEIVDDHARHPPYGSNLTFPVESYTRFNQTSGTTGRPVRWLDTPESWNWMVDCWIRVYQSAGASPADRVFFPFSFGPFLGFWVAFEAATRMGCLAISGGSMRSAARLRSILDNNVTVLCSTPSYAVHLSEVARDQNIDLKSSKVRTILVAGEPGGSIPGTRSLIEQLWPGARVVDHHGMTEIGPVTYQCPDRPGVLHVMETAFFPEVIDPADYKPVEPGGSGELVLTNLGRLGSPLLRYRTGDLVRRAENIQCRCGSSELALAGGILARIDDMVIVRGVNVYPSAVEEILRSCGVTEFSVDVYSERALGQLKIQIEAVNDGADSARLSGQVANALLNTLGFNVVVDALPRGTLPRFEGKAKRWTRR